MTHSRGLKPAGLAALVVIGAMNISAQPSFDSAGDATLNGDYFVRQVLLANVDQNTGTVGRALSIVGIMTFDGQGGYSFSGQQMDTSTGSAGPYSITGTYAVAPNGLAVIQNPIDAAQYEFGAVGVIGPTAIVASSTESPHKDIFIAIPAGTGISNTSLQGAYNVGFIDFLQGKASLVRDGHFTLVTSGNGSFGNVSVNGAMANQGSQNTNQVLTGVTYNITNANGSGTVDFPVLPSLSALVSGQKTFFVSADGNILLGGSPDGFDVILGVRALSAPATNNIYQGTYYIGGLENNAANLTKGVNSVDAFAGSVFSLGQGTAISHLRLLSFNSSAIDYTYEPTPYSLSSSGTFNDGLLLGMLGAEGQAFVEVGTGTYYSLTAGFTAGQFPSQTLLLDPLKIWNAASFAPITNSVAPGEFVSLFGTGLASTSTGAQSLPLPTTLGNVQVTVNGVLAPISYVSANQINVLVPYGTPANSYATFQVTNGLGVSNAVTLYTNATAPGVFASTHGGFAPGVGPAAALHADFLPVTQTDPAVVGETLQLYVTGLGSVTPAVADGAAAPFSPLSTVDADVGVFVDGQPATVTFKGLAPGFAGLYQLNFVVPSGISSGALVYVAVSTPGAYTSEAKLYTK